MNLIKESNNVDFQEEFIIINSNNDANECQTCRETETSDRMKSIESSSHITHLIQEEKKLKSLHRRLEIRIKRFLHRTRKSISLQEKLLNLEKCSQQELMIRHDLQTRIKPIRQHRLPLEDFDKLQEKNQHLEKEIQTICRQIKQIEQERKVNRKSDPKSNFIEQQHAKAVVMRSEDRLHRMKMEMSTICSDNADLRLDIKRMLDSRRVMIEEYNQLIIATQRAVNESRQLTSECSDSYANRRNLVARMQSMRDQHERDEKKLLNDIRELDRLSESNLTSKNFFFKKSNLRQEQTQLNEIFAGKRSRGVKSAYTAQEFRRFFRTGFGQDLVKEKNLSRTVEIFLDEREQSFALFEYAVDLINELDHLRHQLDQQKRYLNNLFSQDNVNSTSIRDIFSQLERSVDDAEANVQSLEIAKNNGRNLLIHAYQLIEDFYHQLDCHTKTSLTHLHRVAQEPINDRNILLYLASIESCVQQLLPLVKIHRRSGGRLGHNHLDETTISWRIDHRHPDHQSHPLTSMNHLSSRTYQYTTNFAHIDAMIPTIPDFNQIHVDHDEIQETNQSLPSAVVNAVLQVYNDCDQRYPNANSTIGRR